MEVGTLKNHIACGIIRAATLSTKDTGYTHRFLSVADTQVVLAKLVLLAIECCKACAIRLCTDNYLVPCYHIGIKAVHWLTVCHHDIVRNVYDIVDWAQTDYTQLVL